MLLQNKNKWDLITPKDLSNYQIHDVDNKWILSREYAKNYDLCRLQVLLNQKFFEPNLGLEGACLGGHRNLAEWMIQKGADLWNLGFEGACKGGSRELVEFMIEKGGRFDWNIGLKEACKGGSLELAELMIEKGADTFNSGLHEACQGDHLILVKFMIEKGASSCYCGKSIVEH